MARSQVADLFERLERERRARSDDPVPRLPHLGDPRFTARLVGTAPTTELPEIHVFADVLEELRYRAAWNPEQSAGCLLTGGWFLGSNGRFVEIDGFRDTMAVDDGLSYLRQLRANPQPLEPHWSDDTIVVGWCLLHTGSRGRLGPAELMLHNTFFPRPFQVGLVIDPAEGESGALGFYIRSDAGVFHNAPFVLLA